MARKTKTMDGNTAAAYASYPFTDAAAIYPITPSSTMAEVTDAMQLSGAENLFGQRVKLFEMQSEAGVAGAVHGALAAGALTTTYTASQGLLLMIPNMYKMAGELLPSVIHVSARCIASHALSIFGDHSDIYACRQTGYAMLCSNSPQEAMDLAAVAHLCALKGRVPFLHFFDGFRTSHEIQKIEVWDKNDLNELLDRDAVSAFRRRSLNPEHPAQRGTAQNPDIFFQVREASNKYYSDIVYTVEDYMNRINDKIGADYKPFNYYGADDAERIIIAMGSVCETAEETVDYLNKRGEKVGLVKVRLYRPFSAGHLLSVIPKTVKKIAVLDRTKEPGSVGEPLFLDVTAALFNSEFKNALVVGGRYGLSSKDTTPGQIIAVYHNLNAEKPKNRFTVGIDDDVTHLSLTVTEDPDTTPENTYSCKFWGLGSDGTVGANKNSVKIIGDNTDMYAQGYFSYDSKKSGGITVSHLRFGKNPIKSAYLVKKADFVACHNAAYMNKYNIIDDVKPGGTFLLNCPWSEDELDKRLPGKVKAYIAKNNVDFFTVNAAKIDEKLGLNGRINTVLQAAFFKISNIIPISRAVQLMKDAVQKTYGAKGDSVVQMNCDAIDCGISDIVKINIPKSWKSAQGGLDITKYQGEGKLIDYVNNILVPINAQQGNELPVSKFTKYADGEAPLGTAAFEKRGIAVDVPVWIPENCIQCNMCSYVCPHAVIRPFALTADEVADAPSDMKHKKMTGIERMEFAITVSVLDCTGCKACVNVCPGTKGKKALTMKPLETNLSEQKSFEYAVKLAEKPEIALKFKPNTVKGSQFLQPLLEFSGACAGCGETAYAKLATQLFGDKMYIANATGCSSIWGGSAPSVPYTVNKKGHGPAWQNSLFEDNAEFGYGMFIAAKTARERLINRTKELIAGNVNDGLKKAAKKWLDTVNRTDENDTAAVEYIEQLKTAADKNNLAKSILDESDCLTKKSIWIFGGDGWAYDIGFGGLDHVIAQNENVNILVFDTEVYSNTGGQASKATPTGAVAQFAASGKTTKKKDLAAIAMSYGYVYVAQVSMGANMAQCVKAFTEAENYNGPSLIICYAPCINHGIKGGMTMAQFEEKKAVESGYWNLFRYNPQKTGGENPFTLDSKAPTSDYRDFIMNEVRYSSLKRAFPEKAESLFAKAEKEAKDKFAALENKAKE